MPTAAAANAWQQFEDETISPHLPERERGVLRRAFYAGFLHGIGAAVAVRGKRNVEHQINCMLDEISTLTRTERRQSC